jgi:hypothetical protein
MEMDSDFKSVADDFFVNLNLQTTLTLPTSRETILHYCEAVQKEFPTMTSFYQRDTGEYVLEGDRDSGSYRWLELQAHHMSSGYFNPPDVASAYRQHRWLLDRSIYYLGVTGLDVEALDVIYGFNMDFQGNRDAIVAQALLSGSPILSLLSEGQGKPVEFEPSFTLALDEECYLQARVLLETRSNSYQVRTGRYDEEPISIYFTIRQYQQPGKLLDVRKSFDKQAEICEDLAGRILLPNIIRPIAAAIASEQ